MPAKMPIRGKGRRGVERDPFSMLPHRLIQHPVFYTLPRKALVLLLAFSVEFRGSNNGSLAVPFSAAKLVGIKGRQTYFDALRELEARGLIVCTRRGAGGSRASLNLYAITWRAIDPPIRTHPHEAAPTMRRSDTWERWLRPPALDPYGWTINRRKRTTRNVIPFSRSGRS